MNAFKTVACAAVVAFGASAASAATYLATFDGNDSLKDGLFNEKYEIDSPGLWKCDVSGGLRCNVEYTEYSTADAFKVSFEDNDGGESFGGEWGWSGAGELSPHYMVVKGGNQYSIWDLEGDTSGLWDTTGLGRAAVSHISFYNTGVIPLPASALLLLGGLGGLVAMRRRKS